MPYDNDIKAAEARIGSRIDGKYRLLSVLGVGGMGAVYRAHHELTDRRVALKLLHADFANTSTAAQRFLQEAKAPAAIQHPAIAEVLDAGRLEDGALYLIFELLEGEDLGRAVAAGRVDQRLILRTLIDVTGALHAAHLKGFVHRDVKPANIFLVKDERGPRTKLLDFGIAHRSRIQSTEGLTQAGSVLGTPYFMSPEQMRGENADARSDLWSAGVVLYYGLSGELPFAAQNYNALLVEMMTDGAPSLSALHPELPRALTEIVDRALAPRIEDRFQTAQEMTQALTAARSSVGEQTKPWERALQEIEREIRALKGNRL
jgi:serine/threonine-protein kinase